MDRWKVIRSIIKFPTSRKTGSLGNISQHFIDVTNVNSSALHRALSLELGNAVANRFSKRLHAALSNEQYGTQADEVDARWIIVTFRAAILGPSAFHDPKGVYLKLLQDFHLEHRVGEGGSGDSALLTDVVRVVSIAALNDEEVQSTASHLTECLQQLTTSSIIPMVLLEEALEICPAVMSNFRSQLIDKISDDRRLNLLAREEVRTVATKIQILVLVYILLLILFPFYIRLSIKDKALSAFILQSNKILDEKHRMLYQNKILLKTFIAWRKDYTLASRARQLKTKVAFEAWLSESKRGRLARLSTAYFYLISSKSLGRHALRKLLRHKQNMKKIEGCYRSDSDKNICAGLGHLRICQNRLSSRRAFMIWQQQYKC